MPDPVSLPALFEAAEQAAVAGDYAAAARHLGEAARVQEATLGPDHLDLANTLNNLAVAHERCGEIDAAEREYRRAHALAARVCAADDPLVTTSAQNLREFCEANGRPVDPPAPVAAPPVAPVVATPAAPVVAPRPAPIVAPPPAAVVEQAAPVVVDVPPRPPVARVPPPAAAPAPTQPIAPDPVAARPAGPVRPAPVRPAPAPAVAAPRRVSIPVLGAIGALVVLVIWLITGRGAAGPPAAAPEPATPAPTPAGPPNPAPPTPTPSSRPTAPPAAPAGSPAASDGLTVGDAELCATLSSTYRCEPAQSPVAPGRLTFYTRLIATRETSVVHRWYRGDQLRQAVRLGVAARATGYRTFSRGTVTAGDGEWRVELRTSDGRLLHTERFTVR